MISFTTEKYLSDETNKKKNVSQLVIQQEKMLTTDDVMDYEEMIKLLRHASFEIWNFFASLELSVS